MLLLPKGGGRLAPRAPMPLAQVVHLALASGTLVAVLAEVSPLQAPWAPPPLGLDIAVLEETLRQGATALLDVLLVVVT